MLLVTLTMWETRKGLVLAVVVKLYHAMYISICVCGYFRRCRLNPDRNAFRKLNLMEIRYSKEAYMVGPYYVLPSQLPREARLTYQSYDRIYRLSFHFLSYFTVEINDP